MNALGFLILSLLIIVVLALPRRWAMLGMLSGLLYLTQAQQVDIMNFNLYAMRFLELAGMARVLMRREFSALKFNKIDLLLVILYVYAAVVYILRSSEHQAYFIGNAVDAFFCYFTFRALVRDFEEFQWFLRAFVFLLIPYVFLLWIERVTGSNPFIILGAAAEPVLREGKPRCIGSFRHPSLLGTLGSTFLPLYIALCFNRFGRTLAGLGIALCLGIVWLSNSGGPAGAAVVALVGWGLWNIKTRMRLVRWVMVGIIVVAACSMNDSIWFLISKSSAFTGGDGWHRSYLLDVSFRHFDQWWLAGMSMENTREWFPYLVQSTQAADITNAFLAYGLNSGFGAIILAVALLTKAYSRLGVALKAARGSLNLAAGAEPVLWALGAMLSAHIATWFGIYYWDTTYVLWFLHLAFISTLTDVAVEGRSEFESETSDFIPEPNDTKPVPDGTWAI